MKNINHHFLAVLCICTVAVATVAGCSTKVSYGDAGDIETTTVDFGSTDLQQIASKMVESLLSYPPIVEITRQRRPVIFIDGIKNKTTEHIDTESITDTIATRLMRSGKFRFVDISKIQSVRKQIEFQRESGMVNQDTAVQTGQQIGAEYMLYGNLSSIVKKSGGKKDVYYKFTLKLMQLQSGIIEWSDEKEIRKTRTKSLFGL
ncbi:MAG TPA: penicillin-binding protein activator LpoB [Gammaproteobacteria bacterium]|nr:penicillin-binding protein activator LpoB [Gammaproteobacteria bacterium]